MPSIGVLEHYQKSTDRPTKRVKRAGGQSLVRQCLAVWVIENVLLQMLPAAIKRSGPPVAVPSVRLAPMPKPPKPYIPESLEPLIDKRLGVKFINPESAENIKKFRPLSWFERCQQFDV